MHWFKNQQLNGMEDINMSYDLTNVLINFIFIPFVSANFIPGDMIFTWCVKLFLK